MKKPKDFNGIVQFTFGSGMLGAMWRCKITGFRKPKKNEWYLSGEKIQAWQALNDLNTEFFIVEKIERVFQKTIWVSFSELEKDHQERIKARKNVDLFGLDEYLHNTNNKNLM